MDKRLLEIFSAISPCKSFADIGCDHGYITEKMLKENKCDFAVISDVSKKCLNKAENLLRDYIESKRVQAFVSDGFDKLPLVDTALIAGMGGEEISKIILKAKNLPGTLVLQPMKNAEILRKTLIENNYFIEKDYIFKASSKFYVLIVAKKGAMKLTEEELLFGKTNVMGKGKDFLEWANVEISKIEKYLDNKDLSTESKFRLESKKERLIKCIK